MTNEDDDKLLVDSLASGVHLWERQMKLEEGMRSRGIFRYRKALQESQTSTTLSGIGLMKRTVDAVEKEIVEFLEHAYRGKPGSGNRASSCKLLNLVPPDVAAYISLKVVIDQLTNKAFLTRTAMKISAHLEDEFKFTLFKEKEPILYEAVKTQVGKRTSNRHYMRYNLIHTMNVHALLSYEPWLRTEKLHLGCKLIDIIVRKTGLIVKGHEGHGRRNRLVLRPTDITLEWIKKVNKQGETLTPAYSPCVVTPRDWSESYIGGYWSRHLKPMPLIKTKNRLLLEEVDNLDMPLEYRAINALQKTEWAINKNILSVLETIWEQGGGWAGVPNREDLPIPPCPFPKEFTKADMNDLEKIEFKRWKRRASIIYAKNGKLKSKRLAFVRSLQMAQEYEKLPLHFVFQNDFRGRKYAVSSFVTPQGTDYSKGLLYFGKSKPIEDDLAYGWLCVHGANTFGNDKLKFEERRAWIESQEEVILQCALDPMACMWWTEASDPIQFLAFCYEFAGFKKYGYGFPSRLPIALDGRNNGLQHLSALGLDKVGGRATCLIPSEDPMDMYQLIYELLWAKLDEDSYHPLAQLWLAFGGSRKLTKRPTMVIPYGGTRYSCRDYVHDYIQERIDEGAEDVFKDDLFVAVQYLSDKLWESANEAVPAARHVMAYLQSIGKALSKENLPVIWQSPSGFWAYQMYPETTSRRITTHIDGSLIKPQVLIDNYKAVDRRRSVNGVSPNFVHSMDAAAMTITINKSLDSGIDSFAMIHDSYGVHAADTEKMGKLIREAFVEIYREDWLAKFVNHAAQVVKDLPALPPKGDLDIEGVLDSKYFFA